ncbi:ABC transporter permease [Mucilaginibacter sp. KACC 22063]|uniref:ABC transporter permease n=1 Tax=Mucilaginibacter sp. KACC 22063 TaxID=3025666 RepID=UPI0023654DC4|nr:FtsX-like permease family protein [Mucilaginibacter sp. KACC 22063]WDF56752.1 ABC transporter permease [Mucilaginibacter sp. KACC 22063]
MNKRIKIDGKSDVTVSGVYEDLPSNSDFRDLTFIAPWKLYIDNLNWSEKYTNPWRNNSFITYVQISDNADFNTLSKKIKNVKLRQVHPAEAAFKPRVFLHPMSRWHLYSEFKNGMQIGGRIEFVWMFGIIGSFVLLLACINFMNLSTARSEKRAKEVGIRKAVGSLRTQLVKQFFAESVVVAVIAFAVSLILVELILPYFNQVAGKNLQILWRQPMFWITGLCFAAFTGFVAGTYPALYLSSFKPVKVLKGTFKAGKMASIPRKVLVVLQFTISVILIIGTIVVFKQVQFAREKKAGYDKDGLLTINAMTDDIHKHFDAFEGELKGSGAVSSIAESSSPVTAIQEVDNGFSWEGKAPEVQGDFSVVRTSFGFGKTINWKIKEGRDFSKDFPTDSIGIILNESAVKFMNLKDPVGKTINWDGQAFHVIGVVNDIIMYSPYLPVFRGVFVMDHQALPNITVRLNNRMPTNDAISKIETIFKKYNPSQPFSYQFTDEEYQRKFENEQRVGKLANFFTILAIFISCLGLYGMASFMAEQRTKELGVRKVLGASVLHLWGLMSAEFIMLIGVALLIAGPTAWYLMHKWLEKYEYRTTIPWWIFALTALVAMVLTLATVSYQSIKAALTNPIKSLKTE